MLFEVSGLESGISRGTYGSLALLLYTLVLCTINPVLVTMPSRRLSPSRLQERTCICARIFHRTIYKSSIHPYALSRYSHTLSFHSTTRVDLFLAPTTGIERDHAVRLTIKEPSLSYGCNQK